MFTERFVDVMPTSCVSMAPCSLFMLPLGRRPDFSFNLVSAYICTCTTTHLTVGYEPQEIVN